MPFDVIRNYLKDETRNIDFDSKKPLSIALAYPDVYENGLPNLAIQVLYREINSRQDTYATRVYVPDPKTKAELQKTNTPYFTWEDGKPLAEHHMIAFSISFEELYLHVLEILDLAKIPLFSWERNRTYPLIIAGGPTISYNPEPMADFIDVMVIGECEDVIHEIIEIYKSSQQLNKQEILSNLLKLEGIYIPSFYSVSYDDRGAVEERKILHHKAPRKIKKRVYRNFAKNPARSVFITPHTIYGEATFSLEFARGCLYICNFCQYGNNSREPRWMTIEDAINLLLKEAIKSTLIIKLFYEAMPMAYLDKFFKALEFLIDRYGIRLRVGAFTANQITEDIVRIVAKSGQSVITVAPEAPEGPLRAVVGKDIIVKDEELLRTVRLSCKYGIPNFGLYLLIGLPGETEQDVNKMAELILKVRKTMDENGNKNGVLETHINPVFPKPLTAFQWAAMEKMEISTEKLHRLKEILSSHYNTYVDRVSKTIVGTGYPREGKQNHNHQIMIKTVAGTKLQFSQSVLARGDRRLGKILYDVHKRTDTLETWNISMASHGLDPEIYFREKSLDEELPWSFIDNGISEEFLKRKWTSIKRSMNFVSQ